MPTKDGVFYDMKNSPYKAMYGDYTFYFSSRKHLDSFLNKLTVRTEWLNDSFQKRFKFRVRADLIAVFQLYFQVETRGCYVTLGDEELTCRESLELNGLEASVQSSILRCESTTTQLEELHESIRKTPIFFQD